jgi:tetratricopeptide (TPR) repeat protein
MTKLYVFLAMLFLAALSLLMYFNKGSVEVTVWQGHAYNIPVIVLILLSVLFGILSTFIIVAIRDARRFFDHWQIQRKEKKESKIQELFTKGMDAFFAGRLTESEEMFTRILESDPSHVSALLRLGDISFDSGDFPRARDYYSRALKTRPKNIETIFSLEKVCESEKVWTDAIKYLNRILEIDNDNTKALLKKRAVYEATGEWEELLEVQQKILKSSLPDEEKQKEQKRLVGFRYELGNHYFEKGSIEKAIKTLRSIIKTDEGFYSAYLTLAEAHMKDGDAREAENVLIRGFEATSSLVLLARLEDHFISVGEPGKTIDLYQKALLKKQGDPKLQFLFAKLYYRLEMIDYALETATAIDTAVFDTSELHALLGSIHDRRSQYEKAAEEFKKAVKTDKPLMVPFCCSRCSHTSRDWTGRCPQCGHWNTLTLDLHGTCKV